MLDSIENPNPILKTKIIAVSVRVGTTLPSSNYPPHDRAVATLKKPLSASKPIELPQAIPELEPGDDIFVVSRRPSRMRSDKDAKEPIIFKITTFKVIPTWEGLPSGILSDVDDFLGDSGGLYLVRDPAAAERLIPIGITHGSFEQVTSAGTIVDNVPYKPFKNSAIGIFLDEFFYDGLR